MSRPINYSIVLQRIYIYTSYITYIRLLYIIWFSMCTLCINLLTDTNFLSTYNIIDQIAKIFTDTIVDQLLD